MSKNILYILLLMLSVFSCTKDEGTGTSDAKKDENKGLTPEEQAVVDQEQIMEYMKTYKLVFVDEGELSRHIEWETRPLTGDDDEDTETLYDLMGDNVIETNYNGVNYKMYYYIIDKGAGGEYSNPKKDEMIYVDYNVFNLFRHKMSDRIDKTEFAIANFQLNNGLFEGWNLGIPMFNSGNTDGLKFEEYRDKTIKPGRGILIMPSGLAKGPGTGALRFDIVLYHNEKVEVEEE